MQINNCRIRTKQQNINRTNDHVQQGQYPRVERRRSVRILSRCENIEKENVCNDAEQRHPRVYRQEQKAKKCVIFVLKFFGFKSNRSKRHLYYILNLGFTFSFNAKKMPRGI